MQDLKRYKVGGRFSRVTGLMILFGFFLGVALSAMIYNYVRIAVSEHRYTEEVFVIDSVHHGKTRMNSSPSVPMAKGSVKDKAEEISLFGFGYDEATMDQLQAVFPSGSYLNILYDPSAPEIMTQMITLRAIPPSTNFRAAWFKASALSIVPLGLMLAGGIGQIICIRKRRRTTKSIANKPQHRKRRKRAAFKNFR